MSILNMAAQPKVSKLQSLLNKTAYIAGCTCGTASKVATVTKAIVKVDYAHMMSNLKNF